MNWAADASSGRVAADMGDGRMKVVARSPRMLRLVKNMLCVGADFVLWKLGL
jgi:hypothetical protein